MEAKDKEGNELMDTEMEDIKKEKKKKHHSFWKTLCKGLGKIAGVILKYPIQIAAILVIMNVITFFRGCSDFNFDFFQREKTGYSSDAIREELVKIGELATLQYNYTIVSDLVYTNKTSWIFSSEDRLIYSIDGVIKLGIDCSGLQIECDNDNRILTVYLPPVKILSHELDESSYHEYLVKGSISTSEFNDTRIDDKVGQEERVEESGMKEQALENAKDTLGNILKAALTDIKEEGQKPYEIIFKTIE